MEPVTWNCKFLLSTYTHSEISHSSKAGPFGNSRWLFYLRKDASKHFKAEAVRNYQGRIPFTSPTSSRLGKSTLPTVALDPQPATATNLYDTTITAICIHLPQLFPSSTSTSFRPFTAPARPTSVEESTITFKQVMRRIFLLLSDFCFNHSYWAYYYRQIDVRINRHGMLLYALVQANEGERCSIFKIVECIHRP